MNDQPARKRSTFGDVDPVAPAPKETARRRTSSKTKVGFFLYDEEANRARAALINTYGADREGPRTFSDLIRKGLLTEVERLEKKYNNGQEWAPVHAGEMPTGRPRGDING